ncbi:MAG: hypothetical protein J6U54_05835 [Clostridiales bacterium]|nr:hypothetical protein [Clostridiales bacterium]
MKNAKVLAVLLATAMLASCSASTPEETEAETTEATTTTVETTVETTIETTKETEESKAIETSATETEPEIEVFRFEGNQLSQADLTDIIEEIDLGYPQLFKLPQVKIDSNEIDKMNKEIVDLLEDYLGDDGSMSDGYAADYAIFSSTPGIYSIVIDYTYDGWDGFYKTYTFDKTGHVYSTSEILSMALISEDTFYETVKEATINHVNGWFTYNDVPIVVDGEVNTENEYIVSEDTDMYRLLTEDLSKDDINLDMPMFIDNDGDLCVCQAIMPIADYHDCERFYRVPDGYTIDIDFFSWKR